MTDVLGINYVPLRVIYAHTHMKKKLLLAICLLATMNGFAQKKDFKYKFYGQIRTDLFYNSRANKETVDGLFYMYPLDKLPDADGKDLNATANGSFYVLYTRLGGRMAGRSGRIAGDEGLHRAPGGFLSEKGDRFAATDSAAGNRPKS